jgi:hypothetical protein
MNNTKISFENLYVGHLAGILRGEIKIRKEIDKVIEEKGNKL